MSRTWRPKTDPEQAAPASAPAANETVPAALNDGAGPAEGSWGAPRPRAEPVEVTAEPVRRPPAPRPAPVPARRGMLGSLLREANGVVQQVAQGVVPGVVDAVDVDEVVKRVDIQAVIDRIDLQALVESIDLERLIEQIDLDAVLQRVDITQVLARLDPAVLADLANLVMIRVDLNAVLARVDIQQVLDGVDVTDVIRRLDPAVVGALVNAIVEQLDLNALLERVDVGQIVARIDLNAVVAQVDINAIVERTEIGTIIARSGAGVAERGRRRRSQRRGRSRRDAARLDGPSLPAARLDPADGPPAAGARARERGAVTAQVAPDRDVGLQGHYAGIVTRTVAFVIDVTTVLVLFALAGQVVEFLVSSLRGDPFVLRDHSTLSVVALVGWAFFYFAYSLSLGGRTFGMGLVGVRVVRRDGRELDGKHAVVRVLALPLSFLFFCFGLLLILLRHDRRALHDLIAGTAVVYSWDAYAARLRFLARHESS